MTVDISRQAEALCQALLLGGAMGVAYDLFRILRVRLKLPLLGPLLDLAFWLLATLTLFLWSQDAWGGQIRLYGAVFCAVGGALYFWCISPWLLRLGYLAADLAAFLLAVLTAPVRAAAGLFKKIIEILKNIFLFGKKWYRIGQKTGGLDAAARRRAARERGELPNEVQTRRFFDQNRGAGAADLFRHLPAQPVGQHPGHRKSKGRAAAPGD